MGMVLSFLPLTLTTSTARSCSIRRLLPHSRHPIHFATTYKDNWSRTGHKRVGTYR